MTGVKDVAGMEGMTGVKDVEGMKDGAGMAGMTGGEDMKNDVRKLVVSFSPPSSPSSSIAPPYAGRKPLRDRGPLQPQGHALGPWLLLAREI